MYHGSGLNIFAYTFYSFYYIAPLRWGVFIYTYVLFYDWKSISLDNLNINYNSGPNFSINYLLTLFVLF